MSINGMEAEPVSGIAVQDDVAVVDRVAVVVVVVLVDGAKHLWQNHLRRNMFRHRGGNMNENSDANTGCDDNHTACAAPCVIGRGGTFDDNFGVSKRINSPRRRWELPRRRGG